MESAHESVLAFLYPTWPLSNHGNVQGASARTELTLQFSGQSWKTTGRTNLHKLIFIVNPRWRRCSTRITTWCTKIAPPFALIGRFLQLQAQNNADESLKKPKGSRKMTGRWKNDRALRKNDRALNKTTGRCGLSFRAGENPALSSSVYGAHSCYVCRLAACM